MNERLSVGISDLIADRDCPRRAAYGARRHTGVGEQNHQLMTPESGSRATEYGSCFHDCVELLEDGWDAEDAVVKAWESWGAHLGPADLLQLQDDVKAFEERRDFANVRTVMAETEVQLPLGVEVNGKEVWFRGRIDRLYERLDMPGHFVHVDYKTGAWGKTQAEVDEDLQMWSYNWAITEHLRSQGIEVEKIDQCMDQLRHGPVWTEKTDGQRGEIKEWLKLQVQVYFAEKPGGEDGLPLPRFNQWCPWCAIVSSCQIVPALTDWALSRIDFLAPAELGLPDHTPMEELLDSYEEVNLAIKTLEAHSANMKNVVKEMPEDDRKALGFRVTQRSASVVDARGKYELKQVLGENWLLANANIPQARLKEIEDDETREWALSQVVKVPGAVVVTGRKR